MNTQIKFAGLLIVVLFLFLGCTGQPIQKGSGLMALDVNKVIDSNSKNTLNNSQLVKSGDKISVDYTGRLQDGTVFDTSVGRSTLDFTVGAGQMIKGFDSAVVGMKVGETKTVTLSPELAYGAVDPKKVITFDSNQFAEFSKLQVGMTVQSGSGFSGKIVEKNDKNAVIDFNHELAGKTLIFDITLVSIN